MDYSPDGRQLVLYQPAPGDTTNIHGSLAIINVDGSGFRPLTPEGLDLPCGGQWSPDGTSIVFADTRGTAADDQSRRQRAHRGVLRGGQLGSPAELVAGRIADHLLAELGADPNDPAPNGLYVINADGSGLTPLITTPDHKSEPSGCQTSVEPGDARFAGRCRVADESRDEVCQGWVVETRCSESGVPSPGRRFAEEESHE